MIIVALVMTAAAAAEADFNFPDFTSVAGLNLNGNAVQSGNRLRVAPSELSQAGSAWVVDQQHVQSGFQTSFEFQITETDFLDGGGADGLAFVIQNSGVAQLGGQGGYLGYEGIANSVAVEFDTWQNLEPEILDPSNNHISVHTNGVMPNSVSETLSLGSTSEIPNLRDGSVHSVQINYLPGVLNIFLDDSIVPRLTVPMDLAATLNLSSGQAWVGFTAGTGANYQHHDILNWQFGSVPEPTGLALTTIGLLGFALYRERKDQ